VVVLDDFRSGTMHNLEPYLGRDDFRLVEGDVRDRTAVRRAMENVGAVVHLAALVDVESSVNDPLQTHDINVNGTLNLLTEAVKQDVGRFVFASSAAVYGDGGLSPLIEDYPVKPISPYAGSKIAAEFYCEVFHKSYGLRTVVLRYFNVYGPGQGANPYAGVIAKFLENASSGKPLFIFGDGQQSRDFVYVDDVVEATMLALQKNGVVGEIFNVCTGRSVTVNELTEVVKEIMGEDLDVIYREQRTGDIKYSLGDPTKANKVLGLKAKVGLRRGIELTTESLGF